VALTIEQFRVDFPEFNRVSDDLVSAKLAHALKSIGTAWGEEADHGQGLLAAHYLATAPQGQNARLTSDKAESTYGTLYREMRTRVTCLLRTP